MPEIKFTPQPGRIPVFDGPEPDDDELDPDGVAFDEADWGPDADGPEVMDELEPGVGPGPQ